MVEYLCSTCGKLFTQKGHYTTHLARKRPCKPSREMDALIEKKVKEALASAAAAATVATAAAHAAIAACTPSPPAKPLLKWIGGKTQILDDVLRLFPTKIHNYYEPFIGGASVLISLLTAVATGTITLTGTVYASDLNANLIHFYRTVQHDPTALIGEVNVLQAEFARCGEGTVNRAPTTLEEAITSPESYYYWSRSRFNALKGDMRHSPLAAALFLFLNKTCFRGMYREGPRGFNVPFGNYKNPGIVDEAQLHSLSVLLKKVVFTATPFEGALAGAMKGDFVYLDPPYAPETDTSFVSYTSEGFAEKDHAALFALCHEMNKKGVAWAMSNAHVTHVMEAFPAPVYVTRVISCRRAIHSTNPGSKANEVLITNRMGDEEGEGKEEGR